MWVCHTVAGTQALGTSSTVFSGTLTGRWLGSDAPGIQTTGNVRAADYILTHYAMVPDPFLGFEQIQYHSLMQI